jgi:regulator of replication initiation timing
MNESDEFRQQVEELKQRLGATHAQNESQVGELSTWFASIKASLKSKQDEINQLTGENQQLRVMLDEVIALLNQRQELNSGQMIRGFFDEIAEFIEECPQPRSRRLDMRSKANPLPLCRLTRRARSRAPKKTTPRTRTPRTRTMAAKWCQP